eukprot:TRINITY_DN3239_c0_g1_i1.p1 TRINITY_DN3239_c0_g1~~TRINITY_DN3239_c0_g1_i1.p1  ORF type:complete len:753 (+),score=193.43 TRINITY_DN3239_c0_g1_i1:224-2482(+)
MMEPAVYQGKTLMEYLNLIDDQAEEAMRQQRGELNRTNRRSDNSTNSNNILVPQPIQTQPQLQPENATPPPDNFLWFSEQRNFGSPENNDVVLSDNEHNLIQFNQPTLSHPPTFQSTAFVDTPLSPQSEEVEHLKKSVDLLTVRVSSLNEIIGILEKEFLQLRKGGVPKDQWSSKVVEKWREKVLQLLVERGANELIRVEELKKQNLVMEKIEGEKKDVLAKFLVKERIVQDIEAELDLKKSEEKSMKGTITRLSSLSNHLSTRNQLVSASLRDMYALVNLFCTNWSKKITKLQNGANKFEEYCMRAHYMLGRLQMVQSMWNGRELRWRNAIQQLAEENRTLRGSQQGGVHDANLSNSNDLRVKEREIQRLMAEREFFVKRQQEDSLLLSHRIQEAKDQFQVELAKKDAELEAMKSELQMRVNNSSQEIRKTVILEQEIEGLREELRNSQTEVKNLQKTLVDEKRKAVSETQDVISRGLYEIERERDKISEELNTVKREYAQSVIRGKQVERELNLVREREKREEQEKMDALQESLRVRDAQISRLKKERNMLLNIIKSKENTSDQTPTSFNENAIDEESRPVYKLTSPQNVSPSFSLEPQTVAPETSTPQHTSRPLTPQNQPRHHTTTVLSSSTPTPFTHIPTPAISQQFPFSPISNVKQIEENPSIESLTLHETHPQQTQQNTTSTVSYPQQEKPLSPSAPIPQEPSPNITQKSHENSPPPTPSLSPYWQKLDNLANMTEILLEEEEKML